MTKRPAVRVQRPRRATLRKARALLAAVDSAQLPVLMPGMHEVARARERAHATLTSHLIPRCEAAVMPVVVVVIGSSGVGKSALVNELIGKNICAVSAVRPTTQRPTVLSNGEDCEAIEQHPLIAHANVQSTPAVPEGVVVVDSPSFDYSHPDLEKSARLLLDAAQAVVFVTTAHRYGDGAAWDVLAQLRGSNTPVMAVLNRVPQMTDGIAQSDFRRLWDAAGFDPTAVLAVKEGELGSEKCGSEKSESEESRAREFIPGESAEGTAAEMLQTAMTSAVTDAQHPSTYRDTLWKWIIEQAVGSHSESRKYRRRRDDADIHAVQELSRDVDVIANGLDSAHNAMIDLADKAREGAAGPFDKLDVNISMGRFGQGVPSALWEGIVAPGGALHNVGTRGKVGKGKFQRGNLQTVRDVQLTELFAAVLTSVSVALLQGLTTAQGNIERMWENDAVDAMAFVRRGHAAADIHALSETAVQGWKHDVAQLARHASRPSWIGFPGVAGLIGVAASGVAGAMDLARLNGLEQRAWDARAALNSRMHEAMEALVMAYSGALNAVAVPESRILRDALTDFVEAFQGGEQW